VKLSTSLCAVAATALLLPGCATVMRGTKQKYAIESTPSEAHVALSNGVTCTTPCKLKLKRKPGFDATISKPGYQTAEVHVRSKFSGGGAAAGAGNVLAGGIIGGIIDGSNGSMNNLEPNPLRVELVPEGVPAAMETTTAVEAPVAAEPQAAATPAIEGPAEEAPAAPAPSTDG
jgi:hypothetical protein